MKKSRRRIAMIVGTGILIVLGFGGFLFYALNPVFGSSPSGDRKERIRRSPHYQHNEFVNLEPTPTIVEGRSFFGEITKTLTQETRNLRPAGMLPSLLLDINSLPTDSVGVIWFGHATCLISFGNHFVLSDPVFSKHASPIPGSVTAFDMATSYNTDDLPAIDYILISHDHYDHLDYPTMKALQPKVRKVICGLGVGAHLQRWGYTEDQIVERDWNEDFSVDSLITIHALPTRHKSGRGLAQNNTLWMSYLIEGMDKKIFISGDGGYGGHFSDIANKFGAVDLAILENGQYDSAWHFIHMLPEETWMASRDLRAKHVLPMHNSRFALARHPWYEPMERLSRLDTIGHGYLVTPMIGEAAIIGRNKTYRQWWRDEM